MKEYEMAKRLYAIDDEEKRTIQKSFKVRPSVNEKLTELAKKEDRSYSSIIERALVYYFENNIKKRNKGDVTKSNYR